MKRKEAKTLLEIRKDVASDSTLPPTKKQREIDVSRVPEQFLYRRVGLLYLSLRLQGKAFEIYCIASQV
jgi:hypothetical protein